MSNVFEGSEKKLEIVLSKKAPSLRKWPLKQWEAIITAARAQILSSISSEHCDAYLLSESSLFVWDNRFTMITCGTTTLVDAAIKALEYISDDQIDCLVYERKNEYFPQMQKSDFTDDVKRLNKLCSGKAFRLGTVDEHHLFMFHSDRKYKPELNDRTLEILMYDLQGTAKEVFNTEGLTREEIRELTKVDKILAGFNVDDFAFSPIGYSVNALKDHYYFTIHVTPQEASPYVSFETNMVDKGQIQEVVSSVIDVFKPRSFDTVFFDSSDRQELIELPGYQRRCDVRQSFECGYSLQYGQFALPDVVLDSVFELKIE
jgi:S-adenosylmethionine decarboxylase